MYYLGQIVRIKVLPGTGFRLARIVGHYTSAESVDDLFISTADQRHRHEMISVNWIYSLSEVQAMFPAHPPVFPENVTGSDSFLDTCLHYEIPPSSITGIALQSTPDPDEILMADRILLRYQIEYTSDPNFKPVPLIRPLGLLCLCCSLLCVLDVSLSLVFCCFPLHTSSLHALIYISLLMSFIVLCLQCHLCRKCSLISLLLLRCQWLESSRRCMHLLDSLLTGSELWFARIAR